MVVGHKPGPVELSTGKVFSGPAGQIVRFIVESILVKAYMTNLIKTPKDERTDEAQLRDTTIATEMATVQPLVVVTMGAEATSYVRDTKHSIKTVHGLVMPTERFGQQFFTLPVYSPGYIIRSGGLESKIGEEWLADWEELRNIDGLRDFQAYPRPRTRD